jgi:uncharacterized protein (DUF1800 family)
MKAAKGVGWIAAVVLMAAHAPSALERARSAVPANADDRTIVHVLNRIGFGAASGDIDRVRRMGLQTYIDQQLHPSRLADDGMAARLSSFQTLSKTTREMAEQYFLPAQMARQEQQRRQAAQDPAMSAGNPPAERPRQEERPRPEMMNAGQTAAIRMERLALTELAQAKVMRAAYSERQLEEVLVDFWFNHFNVFAGKGQVRVYLGEYERDAIRPHVLGKFRDLLQATAESPAMLFYLDNWQSAAPEGAARSVPMRPVRPVRPVRPGRRADFPRPAMPAAPAPAPNRRRGLNENYARELMELHTLGVDGGYTQKDVQEVARAFTGWTIANPRQGGGFRFDPRMHDDGEKIVLGHKIKGGGGKKDGDDVIALLAKHPSTARFIATKLARRFVADAPPKALVDRGAQRFRETDGDIREVVRAIVTSPEFFAAEAYRAKVKTPLEFVVSAVRATGVQVTNALPLVQAIRTMGMPIYGCQPPTGYADQAEAWVNSGALLNRMNFAVLLTSGRQPGALGIATIAGDQVVASSLAGDISEPTASTVAKATHPSQALALVLGSPEFQRR